MRFLLQISLCILLAGPVMAQRGGGGGSHGGGGGGFHGGGSMGGGGFRGGGGFGGGIGGGFRGGYGGGYGGGFRGGYGGFGYGFNRGYGYRGYGLGFYGGYYPYWGYGYGYWPGYYDYYPYDYYSSPYAYGYGSYNTSPNVTVVYPQQAQAAAPVYVERANPVMHQYDQYGQEVGTTNGGGSPIYLIAFQDHAIRAAASYWVEGSTLHYVTLQHEEKQAPLESVDRDLSVRLNRERHVQLQLPQ